MANEVQFTHEIKVKGSIRREYPPASVGLNAIGDFNPSLSPTQIYTVSVEDVPTLPGVDLDLNVLVNALGEAFSFESVLSLWIKNTASVGDLLIKPKSGGTGWLVLLNAATAFIRIPPLGLLVCASETGWDVAEGAGVLQIISDSVDLASCEFIVSGIERES